MSTLIGKSPLGPWNLFGLGTCLANPLYFLAYKESITAGKKALGKQGSTYLKNTELKATESGQNKHKICYDLDNISHKVSTLYFTEDNIMKS